MKIRPYESKDAPALSRLFRRSVKEIGCMDYSEQQILAWISAGPSPERLEELMKQNRTRLVAVNASDQPIAFADLEADGHIDFLYSSPEVAGQGVASRLYDELENLAKTLKAPQLTAEASETALGFFKRKGFAVKSRRDFEISGVMIHNYAVEKTL